MAVKAKSSDHTIFFTQTDLWTHLNFFNCMNTKHVHEIFLGAFQPVIKRLFKNIETM